MHANPVAALVNRLGEIATAARKRGQEATTSRRRGFCRPGGALSETGACREPGPGEQAPIHGAQAGERYFFDGECRAA